MIKDIGIKIFSVGVMVLILTSCSKFLNKEPLDQLSSQTFWQTQQDADMALAGVYNRLTSSTFDYQQMMWSILGGDADYSQQSQGSSSLQTLAAGVITPTSGGLVSSIYDDCYNGISSCNFFLANIGRTPISDETKTQYEAQVRFLRALSYFTLTNFYGGVPLYTAPVTVEEARIKQSTVAEVDTQIYKDLDFAIANLPNTQYSGYAVKGSALALKAKVLLYNEQYSKAAEVANEIIQSGVFHLCDNYQSLFLKSEQINNPEIIFSSKFLNPNYYSDQDIEIGWWGLINPRQEFVNAFECTDGQPISTSPLYDPNHPFKNRDPRLAYTVARVSQALVNSAGDSVYLNGSGGSSSVTGYEALKGVNLDAYPYDYSTKSDQDWVLLRYAGVLLMYAEAENEAVGPDASVYAAINMVRARPSVNMPPLPQGLNQGQMREAIREERRVELGLEGDRYLDIKRWKIAQTYIPTLVDPGGTHRQFDPNKNYLFPFSQSEIDANPKLVQNPGY